uniref:TFIIS n=1 Tax=Aceria tosichella TaxID=561515 RepID=A0A6G1SD73_9ACAR
MEEVARIKVELEKAFGDNDVKKTVELLEQLVNQPVTMMVLQDTHIGLTVNTIRKSLTNAEALALCKKVLKKWKKMAEFYKQQEEAPTTTSTVRTKFRKMITDALKLPLPKDLQNQEPFLDEESLAARIEECIFQEFKNESDKRYMNRVRSRIINLKDAKNPYLRLNVLRGDISAERIAKMTPEEMASDDLKKQREEITQQAIRDHQMALTGGTTSSEIKCPACKKYDCSYNQMQTRSADEPMTTFCHCNNCGKRWKFC